jgi:hypothetical protein
LATRRFTGSSLIATWRSIQATAATGAPASPCFVHLVGLCAVLEHDASPPYATKLLDRVIQQHDEFPVLERTKGPGRLTVLHMLGAADLADYADRDRKWASAVWDSWSAQHEVIRTALRDVTNRERS